MGTRECHTHAPRALTLQYLAGLARLVHHPDSHTDGKVVLRVLRLLWLLRQLLHHMVPQRVRRWAGSLASTLLMLLLLLLLVRLPLPLRLCSQEREITVWEELDGSLGRVGVGNAADDRARR